MELLNPWGLISLIAVPALIALYILKQKHKELRIPSVLLWQKTQSMTEASTPWQKLKKNLLFILQLIIVILICLAISRPAISTNNIYDEVIVIIDSSASMRAEEDGSTRFEKAVKEAVSAADTLRPGKKMSVIFAGDSVIPAITGSENRIDIKKAIKSYECGYAGSDMDNAVLLAQSMKAEEGRSLITVYTDSAVETSDLGPEIEVINVASSKNNTAVKNMSCAGDETGFTVLSSVESFSTDRKVTLELYCDGRLTDAKQVELKAGETVGVFWKNISPSYSLATVKIKDKDILPEDDSLSIPLTQNEKKKVFIVSDQSFFLEKIFNALGRYELYKAKPSDYNALEKSDYDLIIFDCFVPEVVPDHGAVWFFAPDKDIPGIKKGSLIKGTTLSAADTETAADIAEYVNLKEVALAKFLEFECDESWNMVALCGFYPAIAVKTEKNGQRFAAFAFDIHDSNLPLLKEFPILMQNLASYSMPEMTDGNGLYVTGSMPEIRALAYSTEVSVTKPDGEKVTLAPPFPVSQLRLDLPGIYEIDQAVKKTTDGKENVTNIKGYVIASIPESESSMAGTVITDEGGNIAKGKFKGQAEIWPYLIILALLILMAEWWVYYREY